MEEAAEWAQLGHQVREGVGLWCMVMALVFWGVALVYGVWLWCMALVYGSGALGCGSGVWCVAVV